MKDITFERDQLDRADPAPATCRHGYIPVADEPCPDCQPGPFARLLVAGVPEAEAIEIMDAGYAPEDANGRPVLVNDLVQNIRSKRTYFVTAVKDNRLVLYKHGWPRIRNANPTNWRVIPRMAVNA